MPHQPKLYRPGVPRKAQVHQRNRQATRAMHTGSKGWRILRATILERDLFTCQHKGCGQYGDQVDHKDGDSHNNDPGNLQTLCIKHHSAKTMAELNGKQPRVIP